MDINRDSYRQSLNYLFGVSIRNFLLAAAIGSLFASLLMILIPPFQSPDEQDHLKRAYLLSKARIVMETPEGHSTGGFINDGLNEYASIFLGVAGKPDEKITDEMLQQAKLVRWASSETFNEAPGVSYYIPFIYTPQALGLATGRLLDLSVHHSYFLARTLVATTIFLLLWMSFRVRSPGPLTIALLLMPLMLFQAIATSQDGVAMALLVLCVSLFLQIMKNDNEVSWRFYSMFLVTLLLLVTSRINLFPMLLLPLMIVFKHKKPCLAWWAAAIILCSFGWVLYAMMTTVDARVSIGAKPVELLLYYLQHPFQYIHLVFASLSHVQLGHLYATSFVGVLGWLDAGIGDRAVYFYYLISAAVLILSISISSLRAQLQGNISLLVVAISSFLLVFLLLLITWTPHPADVILGVQGRYFWASAIIFSMAISSEFSSLSRLKQNACIFLLFALAVLSLVSMTTTVVQRYYLSSTDVSASNSVNIELAAHSYHEATIESLSQQVRVPSGGFIDQVLINNDKISITGWGFFSQAEKLFYSNQQVSYRILYKTIPRPDVSNATRDKSLILAGFEIKIALEDLSDISEGFCLYTNDPAFGIRRLQSGNAASGYQCEVSNSESE